MTVEKYLANQPEKQRALLQELSNYILRAVPEAQPLINYGIMAFALTEGGKRDQQIMIAGFKNHIGFYPHPTTIEYFEDQLQGYKKAKGSVQFPLSKPLPEDLIIQMVTYRKALLDKA